MFDQMLVGAIFPDHWQVRERSIIRALFVGWWVKLCCRIISRVHGGVIMQNHWSDAGKEHNCLNGRHEPY